MSQVAHINRFRAEKYRGISGLELENLSGINLFVGKNGSGKSSVLEALWLLHGRLNPDIFWSTHIQRIPRATENPLAEICGQGFELRGEENGAEHSLEAVFEPQKPSAFSGRDVKKLPSLGKLRVWIDGREMKRGETVWRPVSIGGRGVEMPNMSPPRDRPRGVIEGVAFSTMVTEDTVEIFSQVVSRGDKKAFEQNLRTLLPIIRDVDIVEEDPSGTSYILATTQGNDQFSIEALGAVLHSQNGIVLIDEIETGLHHSLLPKLWELLREASERFNVQVFATTHSWDCLHSAIAAFREYDDLFSVHVLYHNSKENRIDADALCGESLRVAQEMNLEIR